MFLFLLLMLLWRSKQGAVLLLWEKWGRYTGYSIKSCFRVVNGTVVAGVGSVDAAAVAADAAVAGVDATGAFEF